MAWVQRINLLRVPVLVFLAGFVGLMAALCWALSGLPPEQLAQAVGLLGSGVIFSLIALFVAVGASAHRCLRQLRRGRQGGFGVALQIIPYLVAMLAAISVFRSSGCMGYLLERSGRSCAGPGSMPTSCRRCRSA